MKKNWTIIMLFLLGIITGGCIIACAKKEVEQDGIYMTQAQSNPLIGLAVDNQGGTLALTASASAVLKQDANVTFRINPELVEKYNAQNGTDFIALPKHLAKLNAEQATIRSGSNVSDAINLAVSPFDDSTEDGVQYMLPIEIVSTTSNNFPIIEGSRVLYVHLQKVSVSSALKFNKSNINYKIADPLTNINQWSIEFMVNFSKFANIAVMGAYPDEIFVRFGDVISLPNQLQVKLAGLQPFSKTEFQTNKWYHVALVFDGNLNRFTMYVNGEVDFSIATPAGKRFNISTIWFGSVYSSAPWSGKEVRFWTRALTQKEIRYGMCAVNPKSEGLYGYWKLNEGSGNTINDATGKGHVGETEKTNDWISSVRCPE